MAKIHAPEYACLATFRVIDAGDDSCDHQWEKTEDDDYIWWKCVKCPKRCGCEVYD